MCNFGPFLAKKMANFEFSAKKRNCHIFTVTESQVHEKNQKNMMRGFLRKSGRTDGRMDGRTDGRTDKRESIGLRDSSRPKTLPIIIRSKHARDPDFE